MTTKRKFKVYFEGVYIGDTLAVSAANAVSMVRYRNNLLYKPMKSFKAVIANDDKVPAPVIMNSEPQEHQISFNEYMKRGVS